MRNLVRVPGAALLFALASSLANPAAAEDRKLVLTYFESPFQNMHTVILEEAYERIGIAVEFNNLPGKRSLKTSSKGVADGETNRIGGLSKSYPSLIQIDVPMYPLIGTAFAIGDDLPIKTWGDLKSYRVGVVGGVKFYAEPIKGMERTEASDYRKLFNLLTHGRIGVALATTLAGQLTIKAHFSDAGIHTVGEPLVSIDTFHYLHEKNRDIVPLIRQSLQEMRDSGRIDEIVNETLSVPVADGPAASRSANRAMPSQGD